MFLRPMTFHCLDYYNVLRHAEIFLRFSESLLRLYSDLLILKYSIPRKSSLAENKGKMALPYRLIQGSQQCSGHRLKKRRFFHCC